MEITLKGDAKIESIPSLKDKALRINLNENIYGTFAEIGAGQETVRQFFRAGGASGTIAKAMSAYDKDFSDAIYGIEEDNRYVTEPRLRRMLNHEVELIEDRILREKHPDKNPDNPEAVNEFIQITKAYTVSAPFYSPILCLRS